MGVARRFLSLPIISEQSEPLFNVYTLTERYTGLSLLKAQMGPKRKVGDWGVAPYASCISICQCHLSVF